MAIFMRSPQTCWVNESRSGKGLPLDNPLDRDIAARGIRVRTDFVGELNELFSGGFVYTRNEDMEFDVESEAALACWSDTHLGRHRRGARLHVLATRDLLKCGLEAGCVPGGKKLLRIGCAGYLDHPFTNSPFTSARFSFSFPSPGEMHGTAWEIEPSSFHLKSGLHENASRTGQTRGVFVSFARGIGGEETEKHETTLTPSRCSVQHV
jgi:hypothetical protein